MFDQFKEKIHSVQQDLNAGLKSLGEKAREVGRSKKLPGELHVLENKQANLIALKQESVDAGEEILNRFQQLWAQIHVNIEYSAEKAVRVDKGIQDLSEHHEKQIQSWKHLHARVQDIPDMVKQIQTQAVALGNLEANFEEIEGMLTVLEDTSEEEELLKNKKIQVAELTRYREQKAKERELRRERLLDEYNQKFRRVEEKEDAKKKERQKAFQDVFAADMAHYRTHGKTTKLVTQNSTELESNIEDFEIAIDEDDRQALDDFLGPDVDDQGVPPTARTDGLEEMEKEEEEEEEEESVEASAETTTETEEEVRIDVTMMVEGRTMDGGTNGKVAKDKTGSEAIEKAADSNTVPSSSQEAQQETLPAEDKEEREGEKEKVEEEDEDGEEDDDDDFGTPDEDAADDEDAGKLAS